MASRSSTRRWRLPTPLPSSRLLRPAFRPLRELADHAREVFPFGREPVRDPHRRGRCHLSTDDTERLALFQPIRKEGVRDGRYTFLQVRVTRDTAQQTPEDLRRPALPEHVGRHPIMPADRPLLLKAHRGPSLALIVPRMLSLQRSVSGRRVRNRRSSGIPSTYGIVTPSVGRRSGRRPSETKGEG